MHFFVEIEQTGRLQLQVDASSPDEAEDAALRFTDTPRAVWEFNSLISQPVVVSVKEIDELTSRRHPNAIHRMEGGK